jgi:hypothetical protein
MTVEINDLSATARLGPPSRDGRLSNADVERIAQRVIEILTARARAEQMARPDASARSLLDMG